jgi:hypothetical protein
MFCTGAAGAPCSLAVINGAFPGMAKNGKSADTKQLKSYVDPFRVDGSKGVSSQIAQAG